MCVSPPRASLWACTRGGYRRQPRRGFLKSLPVPCGCTAPKTLAPLHRFPSCGERKRRAMVYYSEDAGRYTLLGYGIFVLVGGLIGWYRKRSRVSLISGALSGACVRLAVSSLCAASPSNSIGAAHPLAFMPMAHARACTMAG